jgi:NAD(P)-dependent dehydrogenase (short-subunit alcohol dehydrogenase family)
MPRLADQTCLVTGARGGIGRAIARHLVDEGARVRVVQRTGLDRRHASWLRAALYVSSQFDVRGITQTLEQELAPDAITVNTICPAMVRTALWEATGRRLSRPRSARDPGDVLEMTSARSPLGSPSAPADIVGLSTIPSFGGFRSHDRTVHQRPRRRSG